MPACMHDSEIRPADLATMKGIASSDRAEIWTQQSTHPEDYDGVFSCYESEMASDAGR